MSGNAKWIVAALAVTASAVVGYRFAQTGDTTPKRSAMPSDTATAVNAATSPAAQQPARRSLGMAPSPAMITRLPASAPAKMAENLDGQAFLDALPDLRQRAVAGDLAAMRVLLRNVNECVNDVPESDESIRSRTDRQRELQDDYEREQRRKNPRYVIPADLRIDASAEIARRNEKQRRCSGLSRSDLESPIDLAHDLLIAGDRETLIESTTPFFLNIPPSRRVRNAERIAEMSAAVRSHARRLIEAGDVELAQRMSIAMTGRYPSIAGVDALLAIEYAEVAVRAGKLDPQGALPYILHDTPEPPSTQAIAEATRAGQALYQRCCAGKPAQDRTP